MRVLIVEDDSFKAKSICALVREIDPVADFIMSPSVHNAVASMQNQKYDLIMLDMALPSHQLKPGFGPTSSLLSGGLEIVMELSYLDRNDPVIILTQFPELEIEGKLVPIRRAREVLLQHYNAKILAVIHYRHEHQEWRQLVLEEMKSLK